MKTDVNFKNTGLIFSLNVMQARSGAKFIHRMPSECPQWLQNILISTLDEIDNSEDEVRKLLQAFIDNETYLEMQNNIKREKWFIDSYGTI